MSIVGAFDALLGFADAVRTTLALDSVARVGLCGKREDRPLGWLSNHLGRSEYPEPCEAPGEIAFSFS